MSQGMNNQIQNNEPQMLRENDPMAPHAMQSLLSNAGNGNNFPHTNGGMNRSERDSPDSPPEPQPNGSFFKYPPPIPNSQRSSPSGDNHQNGPMMNGGMNGLPHQQSNHSFHGGNNGMMSMIEDDH